ncbi:MAG: GDSL-type esterase/lipase family protein [Pirellulales bacterium]
MFTAAALNGSMSLSFGQQADDAEFFPGKVRLVLPPVIYALPGIESNVYFDNIILTLNVDNYAFDVTCPKGLQFQERWAYTPTTEDAGDYPITIEVRDDSNSLVARGRSIVRVSAETPEADPATLLIVGDSLTEYSVYPKYILELSKRGCAAPLQLIGSRGIGNMPPTDDLRHEGYSGWTAEAFAVLSGPLSRSGYHQRGATGSPFVYETEDGARSLDFGRYCAEFNAGKGPDLVTIGVGINDVFTANDASIDERIDGMFVHYDALIESILQARPDTKVGVQMEAPPSTSQDGFRNYIGAGKQTRWQCRRNQHRLMERMIRRFGDRADAPIYLVPNYLNLDADNHYPTWSPPINARADETMTRVNNGTHPSEAGYQQIGDVVYCWIVNMLATAK